MTPPQGDVLLAELDGRLVAALPLDGGRAVADPFTPTQEIVELLVLRAAALGGDTPRPPAGASPAPAPRAGCAHAA